MEAVNNESSNKLAELQTEFSTKMEQINTDSAKKLDTLKSELASKLDAINTDSATQLSALQNEWSTKLGVLKANAQTQVSQMTTNIQSTVKTMRTDTEKDFTTLANNIQRIMKKPDWASIGANIIEGMRKGIRSKAKSLANETALVARSALKAAQDALDSHSPSREFEKLGMYADLGLINGLKRFSGVVNSASSDIGNGAINSLSRTISNIGNIVDKNVDVSPTIRPVLDLSNVKVGAKELDSVLNNGLVSLEGTRSINLARETNITKVQQNDIPGMLNDLIPKMINSMEKISNSSGSITNAFNFSNLTVREQADINKIARQLYQLQLAANRG
jgi:histone H3/H4